jgi:hypothetical protein
MIGSVAMKALCVTLAGDGDYDPWLTLNREYRIFSVLMTSKDPAKLLIPRQAKVIESYLPETGKAIRRYMRWYRSQAKP